MHQLEFHGITDTLKPEHAKYAKAFEVAAAVFRESEKLLNEEDLTKWSKGAQTADGDMVYSKSFPDGKYFACQITGDLNIDDLVNDAWNGVEKIPTWNQQIEYSSYVVKLSDNVDIIAYGNNGMATISARDFVVLRIRRRLPGGGWIIAQRSIQIPECPEKKGSVRANLHITAASFVPHPKHPTTKTITTAITRFELGGFIPSFLINQVMPKIIVTETELNKKHWKDVVAAK